MISMPFLPGVLILISFDINDSNNLKSQAIFTKVKCANFIVGRKRAVIVTEDLSGLCIESVDLFYQLKGSATLFPNEDDAFYSCSFPCEDGVYVFRAIVDAELPKEA